MRRSPSQLALIAAIVTALLRPGPLAAQESEVERAKRHYEQGYQALQNGDYELALDQYQRSYALVPRPRTLFNIAVSEEMLGRLDDALRHYTEFIEMAEERDAEFEAQARRKVDELARRQAAEVGDRAPPAPVTREAPRSSPVQEPAVPSPEPCPVPEQGTLGVRSNLAGATVAIDGLVVGTTASTATLRHPLLPGEHHVIIERAGAPAWQQRLHASPGETIDVDIDFGEPPTARRRALTWGLAGLGTVGVAVGGTFGVLALRDVASPDAGDRDRGKTRALVSDLLIIGGAIALYGAWRLDQHPSTAASVVRTHAQTEASR